MLLTEKEKLEGTAKRFIGFYCSQGEVSFILSVIIVFYQFKMGRKGDKGPQKSQVQLY